VSTGGRRAQGVRHKKRVMNDLTRPRESAIMGEDGGVGSALRRPTLVIVPVWLVGSDPEVKHGKNAIEQERTSPRLPPRLRSRIALTEGGPLKLATVRRETALPSTEALDRAFLCARVAEDNKARDILVLDMRGLTPLYDFFVLATGTSRRQLHTLAEEIDAALRAQGDVRLGIEGYAASKWIVQDYGDVVVHLFDPDTRAYYALEDLWADAPRLDWEHG